MSRQVIKRDELGIYYFAEIPDDDEVPEVSLSEQVKQTMEEVRQVPDEIKWPEPKKAKRKA